MSEDKLQLVFESAVWEFRDDRTNFTGTISKVTEGGFVIWDSSSAASGRPDVDVPRVTQLGEPGWRCVGLQVGADRVMVGQRRYDAPGQCAREVVAVVNGHQVRCKGGTGGDAVFLAAIVSGWPRVADAADPKPAPRHIWKYQDRPEVVVYDVRDNIASFRGSSSRVFVGLMTRENGWHCVGVETDLGRVMVGERRVAPSPPDKTWVFGHVDDRGNACMAPHNGNGTGFASGDGGRTFPFSPLTVAGWKLVATDAPTAEKPNPLPGHIWDGSHVRRVVVANDGKRVTYRIDDTLRTDRTGNFEVGYFIDLGHCVGVETDRGRVMVGERRFVPQFGCALVVERVLDWADPHEGTMVLLAGEGKNGNFPARAAAGFALVPERNFGTMRCPDGAERPVTEQERLNALASCMPRSVTGILDREALARADEALQKCREYGITDARNALNRMYVRALQNDFKTTPPEPRAVRQAAKVMSFVPSGSGPRDWLTPATREGVRIHDAIERQVREEGLRQVIAEDARRYPDFARARAAAVAAKLEGAPPHPPAEEVPVGVVAAMLGWLREYEDKRGGGRRPSPAAVNYARATFGEVVMDAYERARGGRVEEAPKTALRRTRESVVREVFAADESIAAHFTPRGLDEGGEIRVSEMTAGPTITLPTQFDPKLAINVYPGDKWYADYTAIEKRILDSAWDPALSTGYPGLGWAAIQTRIAEHVLRTGTYLETSRTPCLTPAESHAGVIQPVPRKHEQQVLGRVARDLGSFAANLVDADEHYHFDECCRDMAIAGNQHSDDCDEVVRAVLEDGGQYVGDHCYKCLHKTNVRAGRRWACAACGEESVALANGTRREVPYEVPHQGPSRAQVDRIRAELDRKVPLSRKTVFTAIAGAEPSPSPNDSKRFWVANGNEPRGGRT